MMERLEGGRAAALAAGIGGTMAWCAGGAAGQVVLKGVGVPPLGGTGGHSQVMGMSADGRVAVGSMGSDPGVTRAMRWTESAGLEDLGTLTGADMSQAMGVNRDGKVVVGYSSLQSDGPRSFRWAQGEGMSDLGGLPGSGLNIAYGVSGDGSVVTGVSGITGFRWTQAGGMIGLGGLPGSNGLSYAQGISLDGSTIVGSSAAHAFRWRAGTGLEDLGLPMGSVQGTGLAASEYGEVVAGTVVIGGQIRAIRWAADGIQNLGDPPFGTDVYAYSVSGDGATVVGESSNGSVTHAMLWSRAVGMVDLNTWLAAQGADLTGWVLTTARGVSWDGTVLGGTGVHNGRTEGWAVWIGRCAANCDGSTAAPILNVGDYVCFMNEFAAGDLRANCDGSTAPPVLNVGDFVCFVNQFARGCGPG